jgi:hypothetical protein
MTTLLAAALAHQTVLADTDKGKGSPIGLFVVLVLLVAVYFLYRSMNKHLRRVPPTFDQPAGDLGKAAEGDNAPPATESDVAVTDAATRPAEPDVKPHD